MVQFPSVSWIRPRRGQSGGVKLAASLGLPVTGIDLMTTADGDFFCLEVNPGLAFSYY